MSLDLLRQICWEINCARRSLRRRIVILPCLWSCQNLSLWAIQQSHPNLSIIFAHESHSSAYRKPFQDKLIDQSHSSDLWRSNIHPGFRPQHIALCAGNTSYGPTFSHRNALQCNGFNLSINNLFSSIFQFCW